MTKYDDLRLLYAQWAKREMEFEDLCTPIPYALSEALAQFLNAPTMFVKASENKQLPYVGVYSTNSVGDFIQLSPKDGLLYEDGWWKFYIGVLLESAPEVYPKKCVTIRYHFKAHSPDHLTFKIEHLSQSFDIDLNENDPFSALCSATVAEIRNHLEENPYGTQGRERIGFIVK
jgi:hypothetical protein